MYALALPDRFDRVQPLLDAANATNINVTILDAVRDKQVPQEAWPKGWSDHYDKKLGELGCLMSHVRTWRKSVLIFQSECTITETYTRIIAKNVESALIIESDAD